MEEPTKQSRPEPGQVRVAKHYPGKPLCVTPGFVNILMHTSVSTSHPLGAPLSPYVLSNEHGDLLENIWQFSKLYARVEAQRIPLGKFHKSTIIWEHGTEDHVDEAGEPNAAYWAWRAKGTTNARAIRYPNGFSGRHKCICSLWPNAEGVYQRLSYLEARKRIYCAEYARLAPPTLAFQQLQGMLHKGTNLQLIEVDGPETSTLMDEQTVRKLVDDPSKPFGHGYVIAALLLDGAEWMK